MNVWLEHEGQRFLVRAGESLLGRSPYCKFILSDPTVSRQHAILRRAGDDLTIEPLQSRNPVLLNGVPITRAEPLSAGDVLIFGKAIVRVFAAPDPDGASALTPTLGGVRPDELTPTGQTRYSAEFLEQILSTTIAHGRPPHMVAALREMLGQLADDVAAGRVPMDPVSVERSCGIASLIATWLTTPDRLEWREAVLRKLGAAR